MHFQSDLIECKCGCGELIHSINKLGKPAEFKTHHNNNIPERTANWKGGRIYNSGGYILIYKPEHHFSDNDGYIREHRLVYEQYNNCILLPWSIIHHKNHNKSDNRIENLQLFSNHYEHMRLHDKYMIRNKLGQYTKKALE